MKSNYKEKDNCGTTSLALANANADVPFETEEKEETVMTKEVAEVKEEIATEEVATEEVEDTEEVEIFETKVKTEGSDEVKETTEIKPSSVANETAKQDTTKKTSYFSNYTNRKNYDYKGNKNVTSFPLFINLCKTSQEDLKRVLETALEALGYEDIYSGDGYLYAKGTLPVLLTAHMDTVHKDLVEDYYEYYDEENDQHIISSPQGIGGDDRCGVYMILEIIKTHKCSVLFCEDEEIGCVGSDKFCKSQYIYDLADMKYLIELDRKDSNDAVFYDCDNDDFTKFIEDNTGYKKAWGSCSDISNLSPACKIASVNFSCGYYNAHSTSEYVIVEEMINTINVVKKLLYVECEQFEYIEKKYSYGNYGYGYGYGYNYDYDYGYRYDGYGQNRRKTYDDYDDYCDDRYYDGYGRYSESYFKKSKNKPSRKRHEEDKSLAIYIFDDIGERMVMYISNAKTEEEAFGRFFINNPEYCYGDVYDYDWYETKIYDDGWYEYTD